MPQVQDLLGTPSDDLLMNLKNDYPDLEIKLVEYNPENYKNWGKNLNFVKRVVRQRFLCSGTLELVLSDFHEYP